MLSNLLHNIMQTLPRPHRSNARRHVPKSRNAMRPSPLWAKDSVGRLSRIGAGPPSSLGFRNR